MKLNLQQFAGSYTLTVLKDANVTTATASPSSSLGKDDESEMTLVFASGYELDEIEVVAGGATVAEVDGTWVVTNGGANATVYVKSKKDNLYLITENTIVSLNGGAAVELKRNIMVEVGKNGAVIGVSGGGSAVTVSEDIIAALIEQGVLVKV